MEQLGLALYTLRNELEEDFKGTLEKVKAIAIAPLNLLGLEITVLLRSKQCLTRSV